MSNLFLGYAVDRGMESAFSAVSAAGNNFQLGFMEAWRRKGDLTAASAVPMAAWPASRKVWVSEKSMGYHSKQNIRILPYLNIKVLKELTTAVSVSRAIKRFCRDRKGEQVNIISYNGNGPLSIPILRLRKRYQFRYICLVVDPPLYHGTVKRKGAIWGILYRMLSSSYMKAARQCDVCVVLNRYFAEHYLHRKDYYVLDCGVEPQTAEGEISERARFWEKDDRIHLVFTGILHEHSGILRFIEMFQKLRVPGMVLHVFGKGIYEEQIAAAAAQDPAIQYHGYVDNSLIRSVQAQADLLVCPNTIDHPINKVAFPSKIQEYMLSGVPVLATAVNGLGEEYYPYLYSYDDTLQGLKSVMEEILDEGVEKRRKKAALARQFILKEKNWNTQIEKLWEYLEKENEDKSGEDD